ncbi:MAG: OmpA family protein [Gemmatimonadaceae bacterium]|nr:OmpA family protein [Gemmatimonadaceae bacterium]
MKSLYLLGTALALGIATPVMAQEEGAIDLGAYVRATMADDQLTDEMPLGLGGRLGIFLKRGFALELELSQNETKKEAYTLMRPFSARLAYHYNVTDNWSAIAGAGWTRNWIDPQGPGELWADDGPSFLLGVQRRMTERMSLRVDGVYEHHRSPIFQTQTNDIAMSHFALQAGLAWRFKETRAPKDSDKDGVADALDACPGTLAGETVDGRGCVPPKDADNDGVIDANDACANTPAGTRVDARGCAVPMDSDRDGVMDNADRCANTPAGTRVDANGCPVPVDSDGDGVMDNNDRCANTPAGTRVDGNGCPVPVDSDGDGVMDNVDACANTARGTPVDARGCARIFEEGKANIVLEGVTFATGSAVLTAEAKMVLDKMADLLNGAPDVNVEVQGHTDNTGSAAANTRLSGARAESVRAYLESKGVSGSRLSAKGYGPTVPAAPNTTAAGRAQNRRVELKKTN